MSKLAIIFGLILLGSVAQANDMSIPGIVVDKVTTDGMGSREDEGSWEEFVLEGGNIENLFNMLPPPLSNGGPLEDKKLAKTNRNLMISGGTSVIELSCDKEGSAKPTCRILIHRNVDMEMANEVSGPSHNAVPACRYKVVHETQD